MGTGYILRISSSPDRAKKIDEIFNEISTDLSRGWELEIEESSDLFTGAISYFLDLIDRHIAELLKCGVTADDVTIWLYHEYYGQCNMEFHPKEMKRMGDLGIALCVSCWEGSETLPSLEDEANASPVG